MLSNLGSCATAVAVVISSLLGGLAADEALNGGSLLESVAQSLDGLIPEEDLLASSDEIVVVHAGGDQLIAAEVTVLPAQACPDGTHAMPVAELTPALGDVMQASLSVVLEPVTGCTALAPAEAGGATGSPGDGAPGSATAAVPVAMTQPAIRAKRAALPRCRLAHQARAQVAGVVVRTPMWRTRRQRPRPQRQHRHLTERLVPIVAR